MKKMFALAAAFAVAIGSTAANATDTVTYNATNAQVTGGWHYGSGNNYEPSNTAILDFGGGQLALRLHQTFQPAPASDSSGVYSFALGTTPISFDWGIDQSDVSLASSLITLTNLGTSQAASYDPLCPLVVICINDNSVVGASSQNSARFTFDFLSALGFDPNVNDTYKVNLSVTTVAGATHSLDVFAKLGSGASAVPEPGTWALMLIGFGAVGLQLRRKRPALLAQAA